MPNNQSHDPRVSNPANRLAQAVALNVAALTGSVSGGNAALGWSATGLSDGDTITITTDGTNNFGTKTRQTPVVWDMGADFRGNGTQLSGHANAVDGTLITNAGVMVDPATGVISTSRPHRHGRIDRHYFNEAQTKAFVNYDSFLSSNTSSRSHYSCFRIRLPINPKLTRTIPISSISGTFSAGDSGELGEALTVTVSGTDYSGVLIEVYDGKIALDVEGISIGSSTGIINVAGLVSGATATLDTTLPGYEGLPPAKLYRINQQANDGVLSVLQVANESFWIESNNAGADEIGMSRFTYKPVLDDAYQAGEWVFVEMTQDWSDGSSLKGSMRIIGPNGQAFSEIPGVNGSTNWMDLPVLLLGIGLDSSVNHKLNVDFGEVVIEEAPHRVAVGNNSDYDLCTNVEVFRTTSWSATKIKAEIYQGAFDDLSLQHLFVFLGDNQPIYVGPL